MKHLYIIVICLLLLSCSQDTQDDTDMIMTAACGCEQSQKELPWLKELIKKAKTDKTGNYLGTIWLVKYKEKDFFVTNMMLGSGGILYWVFDCSGNHLVGQETGNCVADNYVGNKHFFLEDGDLPPLHELNLDVVIYSNVPF